MKTKHSLILAAFAVALSSLVMSCDSQDALDPDSEDNSGTSTEKQEETSMMTTEISQADQFAYDVLGSYYLWTNEISSSLKRLDSDTCTSPIAVVNEIRYHEDGKEVDHWTELTDDMDSFTNSVQGLGLSYGYELQAGRISNRTGEYFLIVLCTYPGGPAETAGLKRGDVIISLDGNAITKDNIYDAFNTASVKLGVTSIEYDADGSGYISDASKAVSLTAVDMYENPVLVSKVFDVGDKKVGYLLYNSFDLNSSQSLPDVFRSFKSEGISELIVDLRYNGGGYAFTENVLASMIAPEANVSAGDVFQTEVYNSALSAYWKMYGQDTNTYFSMSHTYSGDSGTFTVDLTGTNPGVSKVYFLTTGNSASASEGLIVGLAPYVDETLVGTQTYGKYCGGYLLEPSDIYRYTSSYSAIGSWGIYVMVSKFADKNGNNAAMPDGIPADIAANDNPFDGYQLGDENETMLKAALAAAGKVYATKSAVSVRRNSFATEDHILEHGSSRGILIKNGSTLPVMENIH